MEKERDVVDALLEKLTELAGIVEEVLVVKGGVVK